MLGTDKKPTRNILSHSLALRVLGTYERQTCHPTVLASPSPCTHDAWLPLLMNCGCDYEFRVSHPHSGAPSTQRHWRSELTPQASSVSASQWRCFSASRRPGNTASSDWNLVGWRMFSQNCTAPWLSRSHSEPTFHVVHFAQFMLLEILSICLFTPTPPIGGLTKRIIVSFYLDIPVTWHTAKCVSWVCVSPQKSIPSDRWDDYTPKISNSSQGRCLIYRL